DAAGDHHRAGARGPRRGARRRRATRVDAGPDPHPRGPGVGRAGRGAQLQAAHQGSHGPAPGRHVPDAPAPRPLARRDRPAVRRPRPFDGDPLDREGQAGTGERRGVPGPRRSDPRGAGALTTMAVDNLWESGDFSTRGARRCGQPGRPGPEPTPFSTPDRAGYAAMGCGDTDTATELPTAPQALRWLRDISLSSY